MSCDQPSEPNRIPLKLTEAAKESGLSEIYAERNTIVVSLKLPEVDLITLRKPIESKRWTMMITLLMREIKNILLTKSINKQQVNEIAFQLADTLNQEDNYKLISHIAKQVSEKEKCIVDDSRIVVELASRSENTELFFKDQYSEPYVAVRIGKDKDKHMEIMPLQSSKYEGYLIKLFYETMNGRLVGNDAVSKALKLLAANTIFGDMIIPLQIRVSWGRSNNKVCP